MNERETIFLQGMQAAGIVVTAYPDVLSRLAREFEGDQRVSLGAVTARLDGWREPSPQYFPRENLSPGVATVRSKRPQRVALSEEQARALNQLPPSERLARYREIEERVRAKA